MNHLMTIFVAALFFVLTPGILLTLPPKGSKVVVALTHAIVFSVVLHLVYKRVQHWTVSGFEDKKVAANKH
jgi:hypothetical protein